ncbi:MAG: alpha/beta hydrolase [Bacteroidota bacterium]
MKKIMAILISMMVFQLHAQEVTGDWEGTLEVQGTKLRIVFHIMEKDGKLKSTMDSPDQGAKGIAMDKTTYENNQLTIKAASMGMTYTANLDAAGKKITGKFNQGGMSFPLDLVRASADTAKPKGGKADPVVLGDWNGALDISGMQLRIIFHLMDESGILVATMDSPDQGAEGIMMTEARFENGDLKIVANALGATYTAKLSDDKATLDGTFVQNGNSLPLKMTREKIAKKKVNRPQEPKTFPYQQEEVKFKNPNGGHQLAGTLTMPQSGEFEKVVILITGSGPQDRNEELLGHKPFLVLSDFFIRHGIATLRYDDRGVAASGGNFSAATSADFATDAAAAVAFLKNRKDTRGKAIGLVGHSEGGMIAPIVASENADVDFIVLLAGPGIDIKELLLLQQDRIGATQGISQKERQENNEVSRRIFDFIQKNPTMEKAQLKEELFDILGKEYDKMSDTEKAENGDKATFLNNQIKTVMTDWFLYFMRFNPDDFLSKVRCPVLAVNGELDLQVTATENLAGIEKSLKRAGNKNFTIKEFKGLNHLFQKTATGAPAEYATLEETFNEDAMKYVTDWILKL